VITARSPTFALETFDRLGAQGTARRLRRRLRRLGSLRVPRGPRPATVANPAKSIPAAKPRPPLGSSASSPTLSAARPERPSVADP
jgi:hypothetical protein